MNQNLRSQYILQADQQTREQVAQKLLEIKAIYLQPNDMFTWASGIKSPIYCDNRLTLSFIEVRNLIRDSFVEQIKKNFSDIDAIAGVATAGIPHAALVADALALPMVYVRSSAKGHGRENLIEGKLEPGQKVVVIEDLISTGGSSLKAVKALQDAGAEVKALCAIFTYNLGKAKTNIEESKIPSLTLSDYETLISVALSQKLISDQDLKILQDWNQQLA